MPIPVLLADDHKLLREGLRRILELGGEIAVVGEASDGAEAVRLAGALHPEVVVMDINMPGMNGVEATRAIKAQFPRIAVLVLTIHEDREYLLEVLKAGAAGYVLKDIDPDRLIEAIKLVHGGESVVAPGLTAKLIAELNTGRQQEAHVPPPNPLSAREQEVLELMAEGIGNRDIAGRLFVSEKTVKNHVTSIFRKLDVSDRTQAVVQAVKRNMVAIGGSQSVISNQPLRHKT